MDECDCDYDDGYADQLLEEFQERIAELEAAMLVASRALEIASEGGVDCIVVNHPAEWGLDVCGEDPVEGWCSTYQLAKKLREIAEAGQ